METFFNNLNVFFNDISDLWNDKETRPNLIMATLSFFSLFGVLLYLGLKVLPYVTPLALILYFFKPSSNIDTAPVQPDITDAYIARDLLFDILNQNANLYDLECPISVEDITPSRYSVIQEVKDCSTYTFIARIKPDSEPDYQAIQQSLNVAIEQKLQSGFPNVVTPFPYGFPRFVVADIRNDGYHMGYLNIRILPVVDEKSYHFYQFLLSSNRQNQSGNNCLSPDDREF